MNFATSLRMGTNIRMNPQPWLQNSSIVIRVICVIRSFFIDSVVCS